MLTAFAGNAGEANDAPEKDTTYYAAWEKGDATVTFDADGGKMEGGNVSAKIGDTITLPACTKDGYEFEGWYDNDTCAGVVFHTPEPDPVLLEAVKRRGTPYITALPDGSDVQAYKDFYNSLTNENT